MPDPLIVKGVQSEVETDAHGNLSYFVSIEGFDKNVLVKHVGSKPILQAGQDAVDAGFDRVDEVLSRAGNPYLKLQRPVQQGGFGGGGSGGGNGGARAGGSGGGYTEDPVRQKSIRRMASHKAALAFIHAKAQAGMATTADFSTDNIILLADWFDEDVERVSLGTPF